MEKITELTDEELEKELASRQKKKATEQEKAKEKYELQRDDVIKNLMTIAKDVSEVTVAFKKTCHERLDEQQELLSGYGGIRKTSKGGFSITDGEGKFRITRRRDTMPNWDERAEKAIALISDFLRDTVKKRDMKLFEILMGFLERNMKGDLEYSKVFHLIKYQNRFDDDRWKTGLELLKESYSTHWKGYAYEFKTKDEAGKWQTMVLNFSAV